MKLTKKAQKLFDYIQEGKELTPELDKFRDEISCSDGFEYGLIEGGYIRPDLLLESPDLEKFEEALKVYTELKEIWQEIGLEF